MTRSSVLGTAVPYVPYNFDTPPEFNLIARPRKTMLGKLPVFGGPANLQRRAVKLPAGNQTTHQIVMLKDRLLLCHCVVTVVTV